MKTSNLEAVCRFGRDHCGRRPRQPFRCQHARQPTSIFAALACQPPFQAQAGIIRWHEHYLINPTGSNNAWVVCPIAYSTADFPTPVFRVAAFGNVKLPKRDFAACYANVVDLRNQNIPLNVPIDASIPNSGEAPFLNNPGQNMALRYLMINQNDVGTLWYSYLDLNECWRSQIK